MEDRKIHWNGGKCKSPILHTSRIVVLVARNATYTGLLRHREMRLDQVTRYNRDTFANGNILCSVLGRSLSRWMAYMGYGYCYTQYYNYKLNQFMEQNFNQKYSHTCDHMVHGVRSVGKSPMRDFVCHVASNHLSQKPTLYIVSIADQSMVASSRNKNMKLACIIWRWQRAPFSALLQASVERRHSINCNWLLSRVER